ncbi:T22D4 protein, partial [Odontophorus gujanensis]|nr:T22D4 protein [Odontophorus gujanensis]
KRSGFAITSVRGGAGSETEPEPSEPGAPGPSRFRLVRLPAAGETLRRGRWTCRDFYERGTAAGTSRVPLSLGSAPPRPAPPGPALL